MARTLPHNRSARSGHRETTVTLPVSGTALLLTDVINNLALKGSEVLVTQAEPMALRLGRLRRRAAAAGVPFKGNVEDSTRLTFRSRRRRRNAVS